MYIYAFASFVVVSIYSIYMCIYVHMCINKYIYVRLCYIYFLSVMSYLVKLECWAPKTCLKVLQGAQVLASRSLVVVVLVYVFVFLLLFFTSCLIY